MELPRYRLEGMGNPPFILLNGAGVGLGYWDRVQPLLAPMGTTLAYDRSVPAGYTRDMRDFGARTVAQLRDLLAGIDLKPPYVLVAHSMGGMYANLYPRLFPAEVAGVVLIDSTHPEQERRFEPGGNISTRGLRKMVGWWDRLFGPGAMTEVVHLNSIADEIADAPAFPDIPLTVITAGKAPPRWQVPTHLWDIHLQNQRELTALSPRGKQVLAKNSDHYVPKRQPELIARAAREIVEDYAARR